MGGVGSVFVIWYDLIWGVRSAGTLPCSQAGGQQPGGQGGVCVCVGGVRVTWCDLIWGVGRGGGLAPDPPAARRKHTTNHIRSRHGMTPREASLLIWALAECGHPDRGLLTAAMAAYGDVWHVALGYFEMARLIYAFGLCGFYPWAFVNRVSHVYNYLYP